LGMVRCCQSSGWGPADYDKFGGGLPGLADPSHIR
jgi:hypothetical protein